MVAAGHIRLDGGWKFAEFLRMVLAMQLADEAVGLQLQRGAQRPSSIFSVGIGGHVSRPLGSGSRHSTIMAP